MNYVLVMLALWPPPALAHWPVSIYHDEVNYPYIYTLEECERRKIALQRSSKYIMIYAHCKLEGKRVKLSHR